LIGIGRPRDDVTWTYWGIISHDAVNSRKLPNERDAMPLLCSMPS